MTGKNKYKVVLVGNPNVGKSVLFYNLTGNYSAVSNYPGTTIDYTTGKMNIGEHHEITVIDTPGLYNLMTISEEENVTKHILFDEKPDVVVHVVDAKNIQRMLPLTLQLIEAKFPVILVLNMYDELQRQNLDIQISHLEHDLGIPVVETVAVKGIGTKNLRSRIISIAEKRYKFDPILFSYANEIEDLIEEVSGKLQNDYIISKKVLSILLLNGDKYAMGLIASEKDVENIKYILNTIDPLDIRLKTEHQRHNAAKELMAEHLNHNGKVKKVNFAKIIDKITMHPLFGLFTVALILYIGFYKFVGQFGAGYLVDLVEVKLFENMLTPFINNLFHKFLGNSVFFDLFAGDYGLFTLGLRYSIAIVLPIVATFFFMFCIIEDSGYLVRLSMILDRIFKKIGLSGRSVIPIVLGLGCGTMATLVTRTLETVRERYLVTFLLALTIPCSAQLGVILGLLGTSFTALATWLISITVIFLVAGAILNRYTRGNPATFFMEVPPLRFPKIGNVLRKTYSRLKWYAMEIIPIFLLASVLIWIGKITKIFDILTYIFSYPATWAGLPADVGEIFLYGFFRRDFGIAGLYDMKELLDLRQLIVSCIILTLFVPCIAQFTIMIKERGFKVASIIFLSVIPFAFLSGIVINILLLLLRFN